MYVGTGMISAKPARCSTRSEPEVMTITGSSTDPTGRQFKPSSPEDDDESVEDVEAVAYVSDESVSYQLQQHLDSEQQREQQVTVLQHLCQHPRLYQHRRRPANTLIYTG